MSGFEVRSTSNVLQIDGSTPLFGLVTKGTSDAASVTVGGLTSPVIAVSCGWISNTSNNGGTYTWDIISDGQPFDWYVFDIRAGIPSANGFGLEVFNEAGGLIYSSMVKPMNIIGEYNQPYGAYPLVTYSGKKLALVQVNQPPVQTDFSYSNSGFGAGFYDTSISEVQYVAKCPRADQPATGEITVSLCYTNSNFYPEAGMLPAPDPSTSINGGWRFWIIDVSHL